VFKLLSALLVGFGLIMAGPKPGPPKRRPDAGSQANLERQAQEIEDAWASMEPNNSSQNSNGWASPTDPNYGSNWQGIDPSHQQNLNMDQRRSHILYGEYYQNTDTWGGGHQYGSGVPNATVFPKDWNETQIEQAINDVARNPDQRPVPRNGENGDGGYLITGVRDGVLIEVRTNADGTIWQANPISGPGVERNDANGDPQPLS